MIIAQRPAGGPTTLLVLGVPFTFAPITRPMVLRARRAAAEASASPDDRGAFLDEVGAAVSHALIMEGLIGWDHGSAALPVADGDDVGGAEIVENEGARYRILPYSEESKALLLADPIIFDAFDAAYVTPFVTRERAKNVLAGSSDGTSSRVTPVKTTAKPRAAVKSGAKSARTASTRSKTKKPS